MNKITVIIPTYNDVGHLTRAVDSVIKQDLKLIIVNDGSTDSTSDYLETLKDNPKVTIINRKMNRGLLYSRCEGLAHVTTEYVGWCDSDDFLSDNYSEVLNKLLDESKSKYDIIRFDVTYRSLHSNKDYENNFMKPEFRESQEIDIHNLDFNKFTPWTKILSYWEFIFKTEFLQSYIDVINNGMRFCDDTTGLIEPVFEASNKGTNYYLAERLYYYVGNPNSMTREITQKSKIKWALDDGKAYNTFINVFTKYECFDLIEMLHTPLHNIIGSCV